MRKVLCLLLLIGLGGLDGFAVGAPPASAAAGNESSDRWFVEFFGAPVARGGGRGSLAAERQAFRDEAGRLGLRYRERFSYETLFNGLSISVSRADLPKLNRMLAVKSIYPVVTLHLPETPPIESPELLTALSMTGADIAHSELGVTGDGVRVGIIDTGVDYDNPDLGGCFGLGCRVEVGHDFVGDEYDASDEDDMFKIRPDPDPDDCNGHGTHVAGIVGADGDVTGVAPGVTFGAYRVFGCDGSTSADIMAAAMERTYLDGMDVVNMSIGSAFQWPQYPTATAANNLVDNGVVVVASIGNSGASGLYSTSAPGIGEKVIGVAAFDNTFAFLPFFRISPDEREISFFAAAGAPPPPTSGSLPFAATGTPTSAADACAPAVLPDLTGKVALIRRGTCSFYEKARRAQLAGASAVVLYNNVGGYVSPTVAVPAPPVPADGQPVTIPVVAILATDGAEIFNRLQSGPVDLTWTDETKQFPLPTAGLAAGFTSFGLGPDLSFKPDIGAPGGFIFSTYPLELGGHATLSGTSMSSPHVAGAVALLLEAAPNTSPELVRQILMNSADPIRFSNTPPNNVFIETAHRQGAGMLDIDDAVLATTRISPPKLALGESQAGPAQRTLTLENLSPADRTYALSHESALSTGSNTFAVGFSTAAATVSFSSTSVLVAAGGSADVDVTITAPATLGDRSLYGGYLKAVAGDGETVRVPYAGLKGDYQSIQVIVPRARPPALGEPCVNVGVPCIAKAKEGGLITASSTTEFTLVDDDVVYFIVHLAHQSRNVKGEIFAALSTPGGPLGQSFGTAFSFDYFGRNSATTTFFALTFDGSTNTGAKKPVKVPDGSYVLKLSVLKALGDVSNPADSESWTSPAFIIKRMK